MPLFPVPKASATRPLPTGASAVNGNGIVNDQGKARFTLYTFRYSVRSLMVQYTYAIAMAGNQIQSSSSTSNSSGRDVASSEPNSNVYSVGKEKVTKKVVDRLGGAPLLKNGVASTNGVPERIPDYVTNGVEKASHPGDSEDDEERKAMIDMEIREMNWQRGENCEEWFLREVNERGQVPVLTGPNPSDTLPSTLHITLRLCRIFPIPLLPPAHTVTIVDLLGRLHNIRFESLSFRAEDCPPDGLFRNGAVDLLLEMRRRKIRGEEGVKVDVGDSWAEALEEKRKFNDSSLLHCLSPAAVSYAIRQATDFFTALAEVRRTQYLHHQYPSPSNGHSNGSTSPHPLPVHATSPSFGEGEETTTTTPWTFGPAIGATALDAHVVAFVVRLRDAGRADLVPEEIMRFVEMAERTAEWRGVAGGERAGKTV